MSRTLNIKDILKKYDDPVIGLTSIRKFAIAYAKLKGITPLNLKEMKKLRMILSNSMIFNISEHSRTLRRKVERHFEAKVVAEMIHIDLMDITNHKLKHKFIFVAVDVFSRFLFAYPMENKSKQETKRCMNLMFDEITSYGYIPFNYKSMLYTDAGKEFFGIQDSLNDNVWKGALIHYVSKSKHGASIAEAYIKKLRNFIKNYMLTKPASRDFIKALPVFVDNLNKSKEVVKRKNVEEIEPMLEEADYVRIEDTLNRGKIFTKKSSSNYFTQQVFIIKEIKIIQGIPVYKLYTLNQKYFIDRWVGEEELSRVGRYGIHLFEQKYGKETIERGNKGITQEFINHYQLKKVN